MTLANNQIAVTEAATLIFTATDGGNSISLRNRGDTGVFLGGSTVTTVNGLALPAKADRTLSLAPGEVLYGIYGAGLTGSVTYLASASPYTGGVSSSTDHALQASRRGDSLLKWVNDKTPGDASVVLTDVGLYYDIPAGKRVLITHVSYGIITVSDDCHFEIGSCSAVTGGGTFTPLAFHMEVGTGDRKSDKAIQRTDFDPPLCVNYSSGARSITMRVNANDASAVITCGWHGWVEKET